MTQNEHRKEEYLYLDLTEKLIGFAFKIFKEMGYGHPEKVYQKCFELELKNSGVKYQREKYSKIKYDGETVGRYFLDFLVENNVAVEIKVRREIYQNDWIQLLNYLKARNLKIGLLLVFTKSGVIVKRLAN